MFGETGPLASTEYVRSEMQYRSTRIRDGIRSRRRGLTRTARRFDQLDGGR